MRSEAGRQDAGGEEQGQDSPQQSAVPLTSKPAAVCEKVAGGSECVYDLTFLEVKISVHLP